MLCNNMKFTRAKRSRRTVPTPAEQPGSAINGIVMDPVSIVISTWLRRLLLLPGKGRITINALGSTALVHEGGSSLVRDFTSPTALIPKPESYFLTGTVLGPQSRRSGTYGLTTGASRAKHVQWGWTALATGAPFLFLDSMNRRISGEETCIFRLAFQGHGAIQVLEHPSS